MLKRLLQTSIRLLPVVLLLAIAYVVVQFLWPSTSKNQGPSGPMAMPVTLGRVLQKTMPETSEFLAQVSNDHALEVRPQTEGRVLRVLVTDGQLVKQGQPLFQIDSRPQQAMVNSLQATASSTAQEKGVIEEAIKSLQAQAKSVESDLQFNQRQLGRYQQLRQTNTVSQKDLEQYETSVQNLESRKQAIAADLLAQQKRLLQVGSNIRRDQMMIQNARATLDYYTVRAPFAGQLGTVWVKQGQEVTQSTPLALLTDNQALELEIALPAQYQHRVSVGMPVEVIQADEASPVPATLFFVAPQLDPLSQTRLVKARLKGGATLLTDQKLTARLVWQQQDKLLVPVSAVFRLAGQPFVYLAKETAKPNEYQAKAVPLQLGEIYGQQYEIRQGVVENDRIVTGGIQKLQDGALVTEMKQTAAKPEPASH
ncbi:MAG: efflux RND transporter periplasmic adaptor subunit [Candidatus Melainabacteria bacterium]|nr:efflux RND transporter periplasmic adaptor subunit [Candidatus Melainabacteria bacterium]